MTMTAYAATIADGQTDWVFSATELKDGIWNDATDEFIANPAYRPDLDINLSNDNAHEVIEALGYVVEEGFFQAPASAFKEAIHRYLQRGIGKIDPGIDAKIDAAPDRMTMIHCGRREGYLAQTMHRLAVMVDEGIRRGATIIYFA
jgi:hypothetical protein